MKLVILAATGGVGQQLLRQSLDAGNEVTAVVRNPAVRGREDVFFGRRRQPHCPGW
jgi:uncharacterized protein YbjT (DUF2867 family)